MLSSRARVDVICFLLLRAKYFSIVATLFFQTISRNASPSFLNNLREVLARRTTCLEPTGSSLASDQVQEEEEKKEEG